MCTYLYISWEMILFSVGKRQSVALRRSLKKCLDTIRLQANKGDERWNREARRELRWNFRGNFDETRSLSKGNERVARVACSSFDFRFQKLSRLLQLTFAGVALGQVARWRKEFYCSRLFLQSSGCEIMFSFFLSFFFFFFLTDLIFFNLSVCLKKRQK